MTATTEPASFMTRMQAAVTPFKPYVQKATTTASSYVYGKHAYVDNTLDMTLDKMEKLSLFTMGKVDVAVKTHVPPEVIEKLDTFGCAQLDRLEGLGAQSNAAIQNTYQWCKDKSDETQTAVKSTLNTTVDRILPATATEEGKEEENTTAESSAADESFVDIGAKVLTRAKPFVASKIADTTAYLRLPSSYEDAQARIFNELEQVLPVSAQSKLDVLKDAYPDVKVKLTAYGAYVQKTIVQNNAYVETHIETLKHAYGWLFNKSVDAKAPASPTCDADVPVSTAPATPPVVSDVAADDMSEDDIDASSEEELQDAEDQDDDTK